MSQISIDNVFKIYPTPTTHVVALQAINLEIAPGALVGLVGQSGAGKTTLLRLVGGLEKPSAGDILVNDRSVPHLTNGEKRAYWQRDISFVWAETSRNLLPYLSIFENVRRCCVVAGGANSGQCAAELLAAVALQDKMHHTPDQLEYMDCQLAAIAKVVARHPALILADEPAKGLTDDATQTIYQALYHLAREQGITVMLTAETLPAGVWQGDVLGLHQGILIEAVIDDQNLPTRINAQIDQRGRLQLPAALLQQLNIDTQISLDPTDDYLKISHHLRSERSTS
ncbi:MAG: ATP-binding cassette domain-containing protein [Anaerolineae bacterium]|nr:ATP-binding cassette domain-containing protein [Anaerolineae bacterium]